MSGSRDEVAELYELVPEQFITGRDALVRRLRSEGEKTGAAAVAKLRRPPLTAWALNQVARSESTRIDGLLAAGAKLRASMERALDGDAAGLRQAHSEDRAAMEAVIAAAATRLADAGYSLSDVMRQRMAATLRAAVVDPSVGELLSAGRLEGDKDAPGFGTDAFALAEPRPAAAKVPAPVREGDEDAASAAAAKEEAEHLRRLKADARRLHSEATAQAADADRLAGEAERLEAEAVAARQRATQARIRADEAMAAAAAASAAAGG